MENLDELSSKLPPVVARLKGEQKVPICVIMVGMAGSGKTSLLTQLQASLERNQAAYDNDATTTTATPPESCYCVNLDPATLLVPYDVSIDIRDTVDYKEVMKQVRSCILFLYTAVEERIKNRNSHVYCSS